MALPEPVVSGAPSPRPHLPSVRDLRRRARLLLPPGATRAAKGLVLTWGQLTAGRRALPSFLVIGAQRSGTTSLFRALSDHPDVFRPTVSKGIGYFDVGYVRGWRWYRAHFPPESVVRRAAGGAGQCFESSGYYSFHPAAAERIARDLPDVKVVLMVRDPVERAFSAWKHEKRRGFEDLDFAEALAREPARLEGEVERLLADPSYESYEHRHHAYCGRGRYAEQVRRFSDALGPDRVYVLDADRFFARPEDELSALLGWLGLGPTTATVGRWNATEAGSIDPGLREALRAQFEASDLELAQLTGRVPSWRETASVDQVGGSAETA